MRSTRLPLLFLVLTTVLGLMSGITVVLAMKRTGAAFRAEADRLAVPAELHAVLVLRRWDARRARAYARGDVAALARLYVPGSRTGAADRAVLQGYVERGVRVIGMRSQVLGAEVRRESEDRIVVLVTDLVVGARAVGRDPAGWALPRDNPSTSRVVLVRQGGGWLVEQAYAVD